jgi:predicted Zn-dependent protease
MTRDIPSLTTRLAAGRPVMTREQVTSLCSRIMQMTSADMAKVSVTHTARVVTRIVVGRVITTDDGDELSVSFLTKFGGRTGAMLKTNQLDDTTLRAVVERCETFTRDEVGDDIDIIPQRHVQDAFVPVHLWNESTVEAMTTARSTVVPALLAAVTRAKLRGAGFVGTMARVEGVMTKDGVSAVTEETDSEVTVAARHAAGRSSGWAGQAERDWRTIGIDALAAQAISLASQGINPVAVEPGRRTAILGPAAVAQLLRFMGRALDAFSTDMGRTPFSRSPRGNKLRQHVFDERVSLRSDPADPLGGYSPFFSYSGTVNPPYGSPAMSWVERGVLTNLWYNVMYAMQRGKSYTARPDSLHMEGGPTTIEQMIARCEEGIYVNRFSNVDLSDEISGMLTGVTCDGCFLIKKGRIDRPVKNFRFLDSPFFFLNRLEALGPTARAAFGYAPASPSERKYGEDNQWPRLPMIVPPIMVRDFNFNALADAV